MSDDKILEAEPCKWLILTIRHQSDGTIEIIGRCIQQNLKIIGPICAFCPQFEQEEG